MLEVAAIERDDRRAPIGRAVGGTRPARGSGSGRSRPAPPGRTAPSPTPPASASPDRMFHGTKSPCARGKGMAAVAPTLAEHRATAARVAASPAAVGTSRTNYGAWRHVPSHRSAVRSISTSASRSTVDRSRTRRRATPTGRGRSMSTRRTRHRASTGGDLKPLSGVRAKRSSAPRSTSSNCLRQVVPRHLHPRHGATPSVVELQRPASGWPVAARTGRCRGGRCGRASAAMWSTNECCWRLRGGASARQRPTVISAATPNESRSAARTGAIVARARPEGHDRAGSPRHQLAAVASIGVGDEPACDRGSVASVPAARLGAAPQHVRDVEHARTLRRCPAARIESGSPPVPASVAA